MDIKQTMDDLVALQQLKYAPLLGALRLAATISKDVADASLGLAAIEAVNPTVAVAVKQLQVNAVDALASVLLPTSTTPVPPAVSIPGSKSKP